MSKGGAKDPKRRENQIIAKAYDLVEQRIDNGTASSQEVTHFLKMGSYQAQLEIKKTEQETRLLMAKTVALESAKTVEELYTKAMESMKKYSGAISVSKEDDRHE